MELVELIGKDIKFIAENPLFEGTKTIITDGIIVDILNDVSTGVEFGGIYMSTKEFRNFLLSIETPPIEFVGVMASLLTKYKGNCNSSIGIFVRNWFKDNEISPHILTSDLASTNGRLEGSRY